MIPDHVVEAAVSRAFAECWGVVEVRREVLPLAALRSTIRSVRRERLARAAAVLAGQLGAGLRPYTPVRYGPSSVALGVVVESYGDTAVLLDGTNRAVAALRRDCRAIAVTVVRPARARPPAAAVVPLAETGVWTEKGPRRELFRDLDEELFRPMPEILARAERDVLERIVEEDGNGPEGLYVGRVGRLGAVDPTAP